MRYSGWMKVWGIAVLCTGWLMSANLHADAHGGDGYSHKDFEVHTTNDLLDVCTLDSSHSDHNLAIGFCYGFFEGAIHYDDALAGSGIHSDLVCGPGTVTRTQAVDVFVQYMKSNPQYGIEPPLDGIFRALIDKWPCAD